MESREAMSRFLHRGPVKITRAGTDHYGRTLATLSVNGEDAGAYLISIGMARPWN
ncbi:thermonuclease family protein [Novosphingobium malaysiense]|uniref:thermonuclease family protein n=1 Tax=Novosphingobium malaysiense TaxID=1348853 RepID=UPI002F3E3D12